MNVDTLATSGEEAEILAMREVSVYCTSCGIQRPDNANFCSNCGKELVAQPTEPHPKVHHPWMTAQEPPEQPQELQQDAGEAPGLVRRVQGWSRRKKILWGAVIGFLILIYILGAIGQSVENPGTASGSAEPPVEIVAASENGSPEQIDEGNTGKPIVGSPERNLGVSFNDIRAELVDTWNFSFNRMISVHDETAVITGTIRDNRFPATLRIEEAKGEMTRFEARIDTIEGGKILSVEDAIVLSVGMLSAFMELVLPEWGEEGAEWLVRSGEDLADGNSPVRTTYENAEVIYALESGVLTLTIQLDGDGGIETAKVQPSELTATQRPPVTHEPTVTPKPEVKEDDRIAGKHCETEFKKLSESLILAELSQPISRKWSGYDPASLKMSERYILPLGHDLNSTMERRYGDPWSDREEHIGVAQFAVKNDNGNRVQRTAVFWIMNDNCEILLQDVD